MSAHTVFATFSEYDNLSTCHSRLDLLITHNCYSYCYCYWESANKVKATSSLIIKFTIEFIAEGLPDSHHKFEISDLEAKQSRRQIELKMGVADFWHVSVISVFSSSAWRPDSGVHSIIVSRSTVWPALSIIWVQTTSKHHMVERWTAFRKDKRNGELPRYSLPSLSQSRKKTSVHHCSFFIGCYS